MYGSFPRLPGVVALGFLAACSPSEESAAPRALGGAVVGPVDAHCGARVQATSPYSCGASTRALQPRTVGALHEPDAAATSAYGATMFGAAGADADCKYDVAWTSSDVARDLDVSFTFTVSDRARHAPVTGGRTKVEVFLDETHASPSTAARTTERPAGTYTIEPIRFDRAGRWTVRLFVFDECGSQAPDSPHGQAAFFVDVP